jgi:uncharacterized membrane protein (DUF485 family)
MTGVKITDPFFMKAIADISGNGALFFTAKQFLYFLDKRSKRQSFNWFMAAFLYVFLTIWTTGFFGGLLSTAIGQIAFPLVLTIFNLTYVYILFEDSKSSKSNYQTRRSNATALQLLGIFILLASAWFGRKTAVGYVFVPIIGGLAIALGTIQKRRAAQIPDSFAISATQLIDWLNTWARSNGTIAKLLPKPETALPTTSVQNTDVTDYSFDRLVVCNSPEIAQMLIANNFHFENNCAILSIGGYPATIFDTVLEMLRRNPNLMVYAFHDASPDGVKLVHELRTSPGWFQEYPATIIDLGLLPRQVIANPRHLFVHRSTNSATAATRLAPEIRQNLTAAELEWLDAGNYVELESFTPQKLIQILNRGIASSRELDTTDAGGVIWIDDGGSGNIYAIESFG